MTIDLLSYRVGLIKEICSVVYDDDDDDTILLRLLKFQCSKIVSG